MNEQDRTVLAFARYYWPDAQWTFWQYQAYYRNEIAKRLFRALG